MECAIERAAGANQTFTLTYVGSDGRRLLRQDSIVRPLLANIGTRTTVLAIRNAGYSHYNALQIQFQRRMSHGFQALASYSLSKSNDLDSSDRNGLKADSVRDIVLPALAPSDFDIRQSIARAISYEIPTPAWGGTSNAILKGWAVETQGRTDVPDRNDYERALELEERELSLRAKWRSCLSARGSMPAKEPDAGDIAREWRLFAHPGRRLADSPKPGLALLRWEVLHELLCSLVQILQPFIFFGARIQCLGRSALPDEFFVRRIIHIQDQGAGVDRGLGCCSHAAAPAHASGAVRVPFPGLRHRDLVAQVEIGIVPIRFGQPLGC